MRVIWLCPHCRLPVTLTVPTTDTAHGVRVNVTPALNVHLLQHR